MKNLFTKRVYPVDPRFLMFGIFMVSLITFSTLSLVISYYSTIFLLLGLGGMIYILTTAQKVGQKE